MQAQKYKIWINHAWMVWMKPSQFKSFKFSKISLYILLQDPTPAVMKEYMGQLLEGRLEHEVVIVTKNVKQSWEALLKFYPLVKAAGGLVRKKDRQYLFIFRRGWWDLPKGKLDEGENYRQAAIREVKEEVGLDCQILKRLEDSYHTYQDHGIPVIKKTAWFLMKCEKDQVKLQTEEDIEKKKWVLQSRLPYMAKKVYPNLISLILSVKQD